MEEEDDPKELQLLPTPFLTQLSDRMLGSERSQLTASDSFNGPLLDLQLSISHQPFHPLSDCVPAGSLHANGNTSTDLRCVEALKRQAAEQIRLAAVDKAYAERVSELTRQEIELAQSEFAQARHMWERAQKEVEKAERMKERATHQLDSMCKEITCQACQQRFRP